MTLRIPTGGSLSLSANSSVTGEETASQKVELTFSQPLLKGGGTTVGTAGLVNARRAERGNVLGFEAAVAGLVARTVRAYRGLIQATRSVEIAKRSLQRARELLAVNRVLIETGTDGPPGHRPDRGQHRRARAQPDRGRGRGSTTPGWR